MLRKILFALLLIASSAAYSQTGSIRGVVIDSKTGEAVTGANVVIAGTTVGLASDVEGKFVIMNVKARTYNLL
jgi:hypothetical protein